MIAYILEYYSMLFRVGIRRVRLPTACQMRRSGRMVVALWQ